ncbi:MAG TPA: OmpH family outer membrane protein [Steroidobacteraceae bacterium]|nr:OmpH family outer membrane protein [Steroidobacteraceae bacterium]
MKRSISSKLTVWLIAAAAVLGTLPAWAEGKVAIVDFQRLAQESPQGKAVSEAMRAEFAPRQRTLQAQAQSIKAKQEKLQKDGATMSDDQRTRAEKDLRDAERDLQRGEGEFNDDVSARRNEELSKLQRTLIEEVQSYAKAQNFDMVLSKDAVIYSSNSYDITPQVLSALQARGGGTAAPTSKPPALSPPSK